MAETLRTAAVQLQAGEDLEQNLRAVRDAVARAAELGAKLVVLPENFAYFGPEVGKRELAEKLGDGGPIQDALRDAARQHAVHVVAGGFPERSGDERRPFNTAAVYDPDGKLLAHYRKLHLFDVELPSGQALRESEATSAGSEVVTVDVDGFRLGLTICYDLRFSELFKRLSDAGSEVLIVPAAFTDQTGKAHWHVLLRARAIEWQCWVVAAGQWGQHPGNRRSFGHSLIADPWGTVVAECSERVGLCIADLDKQFLREVRDKLPRLRHARI